LALATGLSAVPARADGDPASDVLATYPLFLPQDAAIPASQQARLGALLKEAAPDGYPIRVAMIASATDLGSVTGLWRQPQSYADFLGQELSLVYHGPLLVVMPGGFGFYHAGRPTAAEHAAVAGVRPGRGAALGTATLTAVLRLAAASGHALPLPSATTTTSSGSSDPTPWIAFVIGAAIIAAAWTASLRARPARLPRRTTRST
jgi:hypothetical protein